MYKENKGEWTNDNRYKVSGLTYDQNGNIKTLIRNNSSGTILHDLTYTYANASNANAVSSIVNNGNTKNFSYDENGNMISDGNRGVTISYNEINLPKEISKSSEIISYIYNANGEKLAMKVGSSLTYYLIFDCSITKINKLEFTHFLVHYPFSTLFCKFVCRKVRYS